VVFVTSVLFGFTLLSNIIIYPTCLVLCLWHFNGTVGGFSFADLERKLSAGILA